jgi:tRNA threonylcarbamoyladenosine biosynthesis protein TsaB
MKLLALEAGTVAALAATEDGEAVAVLPLDDARQLSRLLPAAFDELLQSAGWRRDDVEALAVGIGPGSWTSLRIALATMKTWAQSAGIPLAGVPGYDACAVAAWSALPAEFREHAAIALVAGASRPGEIYAKWFFCEDSGIAVAQPERIVTPREALDVASVESLSQDLSTPLVVAGNAAQQIIDAAQTNGDALIAITLAPEAVALAVAQLGEAAIEAGAGDPLAVMPLYLAPSAAERNLGMV